MYNNLIIEQVVLKRNGRNMVAKRKNNKIKMISPIMSMLLIIGVFILTIFMLSKQQSQDGTLVVTKEEQHAFFDRIVTVAQQNQKKYGVFASVTMAQAALESNYGKSQLASKYFNLFGVKGNAKNGIKLPTLEYFDGRYQQIEDYFVIYSDWDESIREHGKLLYNGTTWNVNQYRDVIKAKNYHDAALGLVTGGYATDPNYAQKVVQMIEQFSLHQYDK